MSDEEEFIEEDDDETVDLVSDDDEIEDTELDTELMAIKSVVSTQRRDARRRLDDFLEQRRLQKEIDDLW